MTGAGRNDAITSVMTIEVSEESAAALADYASVPIAFEVRSVFEVSTAPGDPPDLSLTERTLDAPYIKDYDAEGDGAPTRLPARFDLAHWGLFAAHMNGHRVGGAAVVFRDPGVEMLESRDDVALLWDIRVVPDARGHGAGSTLLRAAEIWSVEREARWLGVETQNINVPACRFYARHGFVLRTANRLAYPGLPNEIQLLWYKELLGPRSPAG